MDRIQCERLARDPYRERDARTPKNAFYQIGMLPLYQTLEDKVEERTAQLSQADRAIYALNQRLKTEKFRMISELDILKQMQQLILPKPSELAAITELYIAGFMEPADEVGGDYYDVLCTDGVVTLCIGDVTEHGV